MNILYGVQGTGHGHISRSREMIKCLKAMGHNVSVLISGRKGKDLWEMEDFEPFEVKRGLTFITEKGKVCHIKTALQLNLFEFVKDIIQYRHSHLDLVITDFEPISSKIAWKLNIPSIGVGHQYAFKYDVPLPKFDILGKLILKNFAPVEHNIGLHWNHFEQNILPPIVPEYLNANGTSPVARKMLVYLPFEDFKKVSDLFKRFPAFEFFVYGPVKESQNTDNLRLRPFSRQGFLNDLKECEGVICNAGFELPSEALHIGKKVLVKPLIGQLEQKSNAMVVEQFNLGKAMYRLDERILGEFLNSPGICAQNYKNVAQIIAEWISQGNFHRKTELKEQCWN